MESPAPSVYANFEYLNKLSVQDRIDAFSETVRECLSLGKTVEELREVVELFKDDEMYEAAQGILNVIDKN